MQSRLSSTAVALLLLACLCTGVQAQTDAQGGTEKPLLQPGEPYPGTAQEPLRLHIPTHRAAEGANAAPLRSEKNSETAKPVSASRPATSVTAESSEPTPPATAKRSHHGNPPRTASVAPAPDGSESVPFSFDGSSPAPASETTRKAPTGGTTAAGVPSQTRQASIEAPKAVDRPNLKKRGAIMFDKGALAPSPVQYQALKILATNLNSALEAGASVIQLEAYGGVPGDKSSDARRTSLQRAKAVRQLLIDDGVPSARIIVRAMGGVDDKGPPDRVDVFVSAS